MVEYGGNRPLRHQEFRDVVVDGENAFDHAFAVAHIDGAGFEHSAVARLGEVAELVHKGRVVLALNRFQHHAGGAAACLTMGDVAVFDRNDRVLGVVAGDVVHDDFAALAKLRRNRLGEPLQKFQIHVANPLPYK